MQSEPGNLLSDLTGGDEARAEAVVHSLPSLSADEAQAVVNYLQEALPTADPDRRWWSVRALAALTQIDVTLGLVSALADTDAAVRQCAALGLRDRPAAAAVPALIGALGDADSLVSRLAADALVAVGAEAVQALIDALQSGPSGVRQAAIRALATVGDRRAIPALFAALDDPSQLIEYWANAGLEKMGVGMSFFNPQ